MGRAMAGLLSVLAVLEREILRDAEVPNVNEGQESCGKRYAIFDPERRPWKPGGA
jgi:hypothetical protein